MHGLLLFPGAVPVVTAISSSSRVGSSRGLRPLRPSAVAGAEPFDAAALAAALPPRPPAALPLRRIALFALGNMAAHELCRRVMVQARLAREIDDHPFGRH